jgi:uncharacterized protein (DUF3084 family)
VFGCKHRSPQTIPISEFAARRRGIIIIIIIRNGAKTRSPQNFVWGLNNNSEKET